MAKLDVARPRAPRGTKILTQAFFAALSDIPQPQQEAVGKAALTAIREQLQIKRQKAKSAEARARASGKQKLTKL